MKSKLKALAVKILFSALYCLIYLVIGYIAAIIISHYTKISIPDISTYEGLLLLIIGIVKYMITNPITNHFFRISLRHEEDPFREPDSVKPLKEADHPKNDFFKYLFGNMTIIFAAFLITIFGNFILY